MACILGEVSRIGNRLRWFAETSRELLKGFHTFIAALLQDAVDFYR